MMKWRHGDCKKLPSDNTKWTLGVDVRFWSTPAPVQKKSISTLLFVYFSILCTQFTSWIFVTNCDRSNYNRWEKSSLVQHLFYPHMLDFCSDNFPNIRNHPIALPIELLILTVVRGKRLILIKKKRNRLCSIPLGIVWRGKPRSIRLVGWFLLRRETSWTVADLGLSLPPGQLDPGSSGLPPAQQVPGDWGKRQGGKAAGRKERRPHHGEFLGGGDEPSKEASATNKDF